MGGSDVAGETFDCAVPSLNVDAGVLANASWRKFTQHLLPVSPSPILS